MDLLTDPITRREVTEVVIRAERAAVLIEGGDTEALTSFVRGIVAVASSQLHYALAGDKLAGENARQIISGLRFDMDSLFRFPGMRFSDELRDALSDIALVGRNLSGR